MKKPERQVKTSLPLRPAFFKEVHQVLSKNKIHRLNAVKDGLKRKAKACLDFSKTRSVFKY